MSGSAEQKELMQEFYETTGWEFMGMDRVRASDMQGFVEEWEYNVRWLHDLADRVDHMIHDYKIRALP